MDFTIIVKDENCNDLFSVNTYKDLHIGDISYFFYLKDLNKFLISDSETGIFCFDSFDRRLIWKKDYKVSVEECVVNPERELLIAEIRKEFTTNKSKDLHIVIFNSKSGKVINDLPVDKVLLFDGDRFIIEKEGRFYEYEI